MCGISIFYWLLSTSMKQKKEGVVNHFNEKKQIIKDFKNELDKRNIALKNSDQKSKKN